MTATDRSALPVFVPVPAAGTPGFGLAAVPTTAGQYWHHLRRTGRDTAPDPAAHAFPADPRAGVHVTPSGALALDPEYADLPVTWVTWHGAVAYCAWLTAETGVPCRLPSEAEWRRAAAGPRGLRWSLGDTFDRGLYAPNVPAARPVGGTPANEHGLHDMTGNVFEWCADAADDAGPDAPGSRVLKGGAWTVRNPESFENATTFSADEYSTVPYIGFRVLSEHAPSGR